MINEYPGFGFGVDPEQDNVWNPQVSDDSYLPSSNIGDYQQQDIKTERFPDLFKEIKEESFKNFQSRSKDWDKIYPEGYEDFKNKSNETPGFSKMLENFPFQEMVKSTAENLGINVKDLLDQHIDSLQNHSAEKPPEEIADEKVSDYDDLKNQQKKEPGNRVFFSE